MGRFRRTLAKTFLILFFFGWVSYPGWYTEWYFTYAEKYAYPASMSGPHDPPWGFWYW